MLVLQEAPRSEVAEKPVKKLTDASDMPPTTAGQGRLVRTGQQLRIPLTACRSVPNPRATSRETYKWRKNTRCSRSNT